jgi:CRP-like cAMP-binding protein
LKPREVTVQQGEEGDALHLIESGQADVRVRAYGGESLVVAAYGRGEYSGEIALLTDGPRIADVIAVSPMSLLKLSKDNHTRA